MLSVPNCKISLGSQRNFPCPLRNIRPYGAGNAHLDASGCTPCIPALGMQAEHLEKEVGYEDSTPAMEAAAPRSNTGEFVARIHLQNFLEEPLTVMRAIVESSASISKVQRQVHRSCFLPLLVPQAMLAQLDAADDPQAGSLKQKVQANTTQTFLPHVACRRERL